MLIHRQCSRTACADPAVATLTYVYSDSTAVLGPLAATAEPHNYDLCDRHAARLTAPRGWNVLRVGPSDQDYAGRVDNELSAEEVEQEKFRQRQVELSTPLSKPNDDWAALADAVQPAIQPPVPQPPAPPQMPAQGFRNPARALEASAPTLSRGEFENPKHALQTASRDPQEITRRGHLRVLRGEG